MKSATSAADNRVSAIFEKLIDKSIDSYYNPYKEFQWTEHLDATRLWMSPELLSIHNVIPKETLTAEQVLTLAKWESLNFYSINVHGIRELLLTVLQNIYQPGFERYSAYFSHFLGEENEHMWFFAQFCLRYGEGILPYRRFRFENTHPADIKNFITFSQILIFEEMGHYYNRTMMKDDSLPPIIRQINRVHYEDESRHISMGKTLIEIFYREISAKYPPEQIAEVEEYLGRYIRYSIETLYSTHAYEKAGFENPPATRRMLIEHPERKIFHRKVLHNVIHFFEQKLGFSQPVHL
jgi:hypothetical protein